ncbi:MULTISPECIES: single-stranded DNA-binding protein [Arcobacteraceae]|uniref:Single-stranded DNA-binding protein n=1 Tax=Poseidonibacter parvus TaxID=1850254 RepID=A0A1P8KPY5_9BACT|nr:MULTISPECIES: single-stranded DNA-binding protein [Arcobacteraceae]APW66607.1 single-stranded DNA-binding protein [Poseidonibacter parvus]
MYNKVIMVGNLTRDIELRYLPSGAAIAKSALATSFKYKSAAGEQKDEVCFLDFNMFGRSAEVANQYLRKGSKVLLEGRLVFEQWTAQDGTNRNRHSLRVETMKMLDSKSDSMNNNAGDNQGYNPQGSYSQPAENQYNKTSNAQNGQNNYGGNKPQAASMPEQKIPEIDIDEDEIPF